MLTSVPSVVALGIACASLALVLFFTPRVRRLVGDYFSAEQGPFNLALFRVIFCGTLLLVIPKRAEVVEFAGMPNSLMVTPDLMSWAPGILPVSPGLAEASFLGVVVFSILAALGLYTRVALIGLLVALSYYLTVPQLFGKVNHFHHVLYLTAILAASRCADTLSLDAIRRAWRKPLIQPPAVSRAYALPLRLIFVLIGILYFWPGFYKLWIDGLAWFDPDTLRNIMWGKWYQLGGWTPVFRIDEFPTLITLAAAATIVFELGFIVGVFIPRVRPLLPLAAIGFHQGTNLMMRISFLSLQVAHLALIDWEWVSRKLTRRPLTFYFDGGCGVCRRTVATLGAITPPGAVTYTVAQDSGRQDVDRLVETIHVFDNGRAWTGYAAYRRIARRIPLLWPALPFLYLPAVSRIGQRVYERVSFSRACSINGPAVTVATPTLRLGAVVAVGMALTFGIFAAGVRGHDFGWPFATYPQFAGIRPDTTTTLIVTATTEDGIVRSGPLTAHLDIGVANATGMASQIVNTQEPAARARLLDGLERHLSKRYARFEIVEATISLDPDHHGRVLSERRLPSG